MPRKKVIVLPDKQKATRKFVEVEEDDEANQEIVLDDLEIDEKLQSFQEQFENRQLKVQIQKYNDKEQDWDVLERVFLNGFDALSIAKRWGGPAKYRFTLYDDDGRYVKGGRAVFRYGGGGVEEEKKPASIMQDPLFLMMTESYKNQLTLMTNLFQTMMTANATNKPSDISQLLDGLQKLKSMSPKDDTDSLGKIDQVLSIINKVRDSSDSGGGGGIVSEIKEAISLLPILQQVLPQNRRPMMRQPLPPTSPATLINPTTILKNPIETKEDAPMPANEKKPWVVKALSYAPKFLDAAVANAPVEKWAEYLISALETEIIPEIVKSYGGFVDDDYVFDKLFEAANNPQKVDMIFEYAPELAPHREWCLRVVREATVIIDGSSGPSTDEPPEPVVTPNGSGSDETL